MSSAKEKALLAASAAPALGITFYILWRFSQQQNPQTTGVGGAAPLTLDQIAAEIDAEIAKIVNQAFIDTLGFIRDWGKIDAAILNWVFNNIGAYVLKYAPPLTKDAINALYGFDLAIAQDAFNLANTLKAGVNTLIDNINNIIIRNVNNSINLLKTPINIPVINVNINPFSALGTLPNIPRL